MPTNRDRLRLKARETMRRYAAWMATWIRRGAERNQAHELALREMGIYWRELARAERLAAG